MKYFKFFLFTVFIVSTACKSFGQKSTFNYVITQKGDTIKCHFKKPFIGKLKYQPVDSTAGYTKITPKSIREYYTVKDSTINVAVVLPNATDPDFLVLLERGIINMYQQIQIVYTKYGSSSTYYWYVSKDNGVLKQIKATTIFTDGSRKERKNMFIQMIDDDSTLRKQFEADNDFSMKRLQYYVHQYNTDRSRSDKPSSK